MKNVIMNEDCMVGLDLLDEKSVDCVLTDPPYGINYKSGWTDKFEKINNDEEVIDVELLFQKLDRVTKDDSAFYIYVGIQTMDIFMHELKKIATLRNLIVVPRTQKGGNGSLKQSFSPQNEFMLFATKGNKQIEQTKILKPSLSYQKDKRKKAPEYITRLPDFWDFARAGVPNNLRDHPMEKDISALSVAIQCSTKPGDLVLDVFSGTGSTLITSKMLGRNYVGFETDKVHFQKAENKLREVQLEIEISK